VAVPTINATINFSTGPVFAAAMQINIGKLGINVLGSPGGVVVDVSSQVDSIQTTRGRNALADQFQTGTLTMRIVDQNGDFNPQNTTGPYYGLLDPMRKVSITATYLGVTYPIFAGFILSYNTITPKNVGEVVYTTITAVDGLQLLNNAQITTVAGTSAGQLSGARITNLLDAVSWPATQRQIDSGQTTLQADPGTGRTVLAACQTVQTSEYGAFYMDASGNAVFKDRLTCTKSPNATAVVFNDNGTNISYFNALWLLNDSQIFNKAFITATGLAVQTAQNDASITKYFTHGYTQQDLLMQTTTDALNYARAYVASRAETTVRCDAITLDLYSANYTAGTVAALDLDFFDPVTITTTQPAATGTSTLTKTLQVFGVQHSISVNSWKTTFTTLEPIIDGFLIGSSLYGVLGTNTLSY
jgi:hypothetical protein